MTSTDNTSTTDPTSDADSIVLPSSLFSSLNLSNNSEISFLFGSYKSSVLFPQANQTDENFSVESSIISTTVIGYEDVTKNLTEDVVIIMTLHDEVRKQ